mgnify:CR=1 FL=1
MLTVEHNCPLLSLVVAAQKPGFQCDNPFHSREPDELAQREYDWCVDKGFHTEVNSTRDRDEHYPVVQRLKRIELAFRERSFVDFNFLVACESGEEQQLACGRNLMLTGKAPECTQNVTDVDEDGVCDKLDECMWDPRNEKDPNTGACAINADVRFYSGWFSDFSITGMSVDVVVCAVVLGVLVWFSKHMLVSRSFIHSFIHLFIQLRSFQWTYVLHFAAHSRRSLRTQQRNQRQRRRALTRIPNLSHLLNLA